MPAEGARNNFVQHTLYEVIRSPLLFEIDTIIENLKQYRTAIENDDDITLKQLLKDGRILKEESNK